jgi:hypothetical protein
MKFIITEEQSEKLNHKIKSMIEKYGIEHTLTMFDDKDIIRRAYGNNPSEYLNQFNDLSKLEKYNKIFYMDKDGKPLMMYNLNSNLVYIHYDRVWLFFEKIFKLDYDDIEDILKKWLSDTFNLKYYIPKMGG